MRRSYVIAGSAIGVAALALIAYSRTPVRPIPATVTEAPAPVKAAAVAETVAPQPTAAQSPAQPEAQPPSPVEVKAEPQGPAQPAPAVEVKAEPPAQAEPQTTAAIPRKVETPADATAAAKPATVAEACPGNPNAIGTSRTITVNPSELPLIGTIQYAKTLPLKDHEVVLTFDDGPIPPYTTAILDILASQCVKATYFLVGEMARPRPYLVRRIYNEGHSIGTHSQNHPSAFQSMSMQRVAYQVENGIDSVDSALGDPKAISPFFRIPGLGRTNAIEHFLEGKGLQTWSVDIDTDDWWRGTTPGAIVQRALRQLNNKGKGIILMHDIHPVTVLALPILLRELKAGGYRVVHVVAEGERPKTLPELPVPVADTGNWPKVLRTSASAEDRPVRHARTRIASRSARTKVAHNDRDPVVTTAIARKKSKAQTAQSDTDWMSRQR